MTRVLVSLVVCVSSVALADDGDSVPGLDGTPVKVERRLLVKQGRTFLGIGPAVLERRDYYSYPGLTASGAYYPTEAYAIEARFSLFIPFLNPGAAEVFEREGTVPDAQQVRSILAVGGRWSLGYGKVALMPALRSVMHFDVQLASHLALAFTDSQNAPPTVPRQAANPTLLAGPAVLMRFSDQMHAQLDLQFSVSLETRTVAAPIALGFLPVLSLGVAL